MVSRFRLRAACAALLLAAPLAANAQGATVSARVLPLSAFTAPSAPLAQACALGTESALAERALLGVPGASAPAGAPGATPDAAGADAGSLSFEAGACKPLIERSANAAPGEVLAEISPFDFIEQNGLLLAEGASGVAASLALRSSSGGGSWSFWRQGDAAGSAAGAAASNSFAVGSRFAFFAKPGALYVFDRQAQQFCPIAVAQPTGAFTRTMRERTDGSVLLSVWTPGGKDEPPKLNSRLLDADALCPRGQAATQ
jgi:hypothetical protein